MVIHKGELDAPRDALMTNESTEVLRAWIVDDRLQISFRPTIFKDATNWGFLAAEMLKHVAEGLEQEGVSSMSDTLEAMRQKFDQEWVTVYNGTTKNTFDG
ncbi:MAG: DUF5076 domain-containing protein [Rhizomicrobium sp.]